MILVCSFNFGTFIFNFLKDVLLNFLCVVPVEMVSNNDLPVLLSKNIFKNSFLIIFESPLIKIELGPKVEGLLSLGIMKGVPE